MVTRYPTGTVSREPPSPRHALLFRSKLTLSFHPLSVPIQLDGESFTFFVSDLEERDLTRRRFRSASLPPVLLQAPSPCQLRVLLGPSGISYRNFEHILNTPIVSSSSHTAYRVSASSSTTRSPFDSSDLHSFPSVGQASSSTAISVSPASRSAFRTSTDTPSLSNPKTTTPSSS